VAGDFNLSPWSPSYKTLSSKNSWLQNVALGKGMQYTWSPLGLDFLQSQIDHIFLAGENLKLLDYKVDKRLGSDHKLIYVDVFQEK
jgi:endonuclease/exonuclease/phosphatase (EEP) superfamily protein YafD